MSVPFALRAYLMGSQEDIKGDEDDPDSRERQEADQ
jgi:hypothetical protein